MYISETRYCFIINVHKITIDFLECVSGTFGNNCSRNCHCVNQPCDPKHGTCPAGGCERGYKDLTCSTGMIYGC